MNYNTISSLGARARGVGGSRLPNYEKMNVFRQKFHAIWAKINHTNFICTKHILLDDYTYYSRDNYHCGIKFNLTSWSLYLTDKESWSYKRYISHISDVLDDVNC